MVVVGHVVTLYGSSGAVNGSVDYLFEVHIPILLKNSLEVSQFTLLQLFRSRAYLFGLVSKFPDYASQDSEVMVSKVHA